MITNTLCELQAMLAASCGVSNIEIDSDCPLQELGVDAVALEELVGMVEDKFSIVMTVAVGEYSPTSHCGRSLRFKTLREFAEIVDQMTNGESAA